MAGGADSTAIVPTAAAPGTSSRGDGTSSRGESTFRPKSKSVANSPNARAKCASKLAGVRRVHRVFVEDTFQIASLDFIPEKPPGRRPGVVEETPSRTGFSEVSVQLSQICLSATWRSRCSPPLSFKKVFHPRQGGPQSFGDP